MKKRVTMVSTSSRTAQLEMGLWKTENTLSKISAVPLLGTVSGVVKVAMGLIQIIAGAGVAGFGFLTLNGRLIHNGLSQAIHGGGNEIAGTLEAIPGVGTYLWWKRKRIVQKQVSELFSGVVPTKFPKVFEAYGSFMKYRTVAAALNRQVQSLPPQPPSSGNFPSGR